LNPVDAKLYDGTYAGNITVDARGKRLRTSVDENLAGVLAGPLLKDLQGHDRITGKANVNIAMKTAGETADEVKKTLNGSADFAFTDGAVNGVNVARMIRDAYARIKGTKLPPEEAEQKTDFSELRGSVRVSNGIATNNDFTMSTPLLRINGKGTANLPAETVDYRVKATLVKTLKGQGGEDLDDLVGIPIPIHVTGNAADPKYALDTEALAEALAKSKVQDVIDEKVGDDAVKGLLKGLLK
jgi:AsmA protein